jgi:serine kinase of HPr protein (carbohydrate metabolism regulator)
VTATPDGWTALHATVVVIGESGVLLRGPSGAGKSSLALALIASARVAGSFAALIADDRVFLRRFGDRLVARGAKEFAGKIERRGEGVIEIAAESAAAIRQVVDLAERGQAPPRLPADDELSTDILGMRLPRIALDPIYGPADHAQFVVDWLARRA